MINIKQIRKEMAKKREERKKEGGMKIMGYTASISYKDVNGKDIYLPNPEGKIQKANCDLEILKRKRQTVEDDLEIVLNSISEASPKKKNKANIIGNFKNWNEIILYYDEPNKRIQVKIDNSYEPVYEMKQNSETNKFIVTILLAFISEGKNGKKLQNSKPKKWKYIQRSETKILSRFNKTLNERLGIKTRVKPFFWNREKKIMECNCNKVLKKRKD